MELSRPCQEIEWFRNDVKIQSDTKQRIYNRENIHYLKIANAEPAVHAGAYTFRIKSVETKADLVVDGTKKLC